NPVAIALSKAGGAALVTSAAAPEPIGTFAPFAIGAAIVTADNDPLQCPARFARTGEFTYSIAAEPVSHAAGLTSLSGASTSLQATTAGNYAVEVQAEAVGGPAARSSAPLAFAYFIASDCNTVPTVAPVAVSFAGSTPVGGAPDRVLL